MLYEVITFYFNILIKYIYYYNSNALAIVNLLKKPVEKKLYFSWFCYEVVKLRSYIENRNTVDKQTQGTKSPQQLILPTKRKNLRFPYCKSEFVGRRQ